MSPSPRPTPTPSPTATPGASGSLAVSGYIGYYSNALPVAAVTLAASGPLGTTTVQSDISGQFELTGLSPDAWEIVPQKRGEQAGAISALDASYALQSALGLRTLTASESLACDVSANGTVSELDASLILRFVLGLETSLPVADICGSDWAFEPVPETALNQQSVDPQVTAGICEPGRIGFDPLVGSAANQSFVAVLFGDCTGNWQPSDSGSGAARFGEHLVEAKVRLGRPRPAARGRIWMPVYMDTPEPFYTLNLRLRYDNTRLQSVAVRSTSVTAGAVIELGRDQPGVLDIALAAGQSIRPTSRPVLSLFFNGSARASTPTVVAVEAFSF